MNEREFQELADVIFRRIEDRIDELELDIDIDSGGGILNCVCENGSSVILSRQVANFEIWVAAKSGGFHLRYRESDWFCDTTNESLAVLINRVFSEQLAQPITLLS